MQKFKTPIKVTVKQIETISRLMKHHRAIGMEMFSQSGAYTLYVRFAGYEDQHFYWINDDGHAGVWNVE